MKHREPSLRLFDPLPRPVMCSEDVPPPVLADIKVLAEDIKKASQWREYSDANYHRMSQKRRRIREQQTLMLLQADLHDAAISRDKKEGQIGSIVASIMAEIQSEPKLMEKVDIYRSPPRDFMFRAKKEESPDFDLKYKPFSRHDKEPSKLILAPRFIEQSPLQPIKNTDDDSFFPSARTEQKKGLRSRF